VVDEGGAQLHSVPESSIKNTSKEKQDSEKKKFGREAQMGKNPQRKRDQFPDLKRIEIPFLKFTATIVT